MWGPLTLPPHYRAPGAPARDPQTQLNSSTLPGATPLRDSLGSPSPAVDNPPTPPLPGPAPGHGGPASPQHPAWDLLRQPLPRTPHAPPYRAPTNSSQGGRRRQRCTVSKGPKLSVRYSTLSEQLWSKSTLGATLDRAPPARAPVPIGPPEPPGPAMPGPRPMGHRVRGTCGHRPGPPPRDYISRRALHRRRRTSGRWRTPERPHFWASFGVLVTLRARLCSELLVFRKHSPRSAGALYPAPARAGPRPQPLPARTSPARLPACPVRVARPRSSAAPGIPDGGFRPRIGLRVPPHHPLPAVSPTRSPRLPSAFLLAVRQRGAEALDSQSYSSRASATSPAKWAFRKLRLP